MAPNMEIRTKYAEFIEGIILAASADGRDYVTDLFEPGEGVPCKPFGDIGEAVRKDAEAKGYVWTEHPPDGSRPDRGPLVTLSWRLATKNPPEKTRVGEILPDLPGQMVEIAKNSLVEHIDWACVDCGVCVVGEYFGLCNDAWPIGPSDGMLCIGCVEDRNGRQLRPEDFARRKKTWHPDMWKIKSGDQAKTRRFLSRQGRPENRFEEAAKVPLGTGLTYVTQEGKVMVYTGVWKKRRQWCKPAGFRGKNQVRDKLLWYNSVFSVRESVRGKMRSFRGPA